MQKFLTKEKYVELKAALENAELNNAKLEADKIRVVLLANHGHIYKDIAIILFLDLPTVTLYINDYCEKNNIL